MPFIAHALLSPWFDMDYRIGLLLVACAPTGVMGIILIRYLRDKDYDLAFSNFLFSTFGSIFIIPFVLKLFLSQTAAIHTGPILIQTATLVIIPFIATRLVSLVCADAIRVALKKIADFLVPLLAFLIIAISLASASKELKWNLMLLGISICVFAIYLIQGGAGYLAGYLISKRGIKNTLTLISSSRNCQLVLAVSIMNFSPLTVVPIIIASIFHHIMNAFWMWALQRK
jgi:predicted Na+-dependent transporter